MKRPIWQPTWQHRATCYAISRGAVLPRSHGVSADVLFDLRHHGYVDFDVLFADYPTLTADGVALANEERARLAKAWRAA